MQTSDRGDNLMSSDVLFSVSCIFMNARERILTILVVAWAWGGTILVELINSESQVN